MEEKIKTLKEKFAAIKNKGWIKSIRTGSTGIGMTLEHLMGIQENTLEIPDFENIEIKTKRDYSKSYTTLFNCNPEGPHYYEIERIQQKFGYPDSTYKKYKILNCSLFANDKVKIGLHYFFQLKVDRNARKIFLVVFDLYGKTVENDTYWSFDTLEEKLYRKCNYIAFIKASRKFINHEEYFKYYQLDLYKLKDFNHFINLIEEGIVRITFKINIFKSGPRLGQIKNHGTSFNIQEKDFLKLYTNLKI